MAAGDWQDTDVTLLKKLWDQGFSGTQISVAFKGRFSREAVIGKAHRLKLPPRAPSVNRGREHRRSVPKPLPAAKADPVAPQPLCEPGEFPDGQTCRYPHGEELPFQFCGHPGYPWCDHHAKVCLTPVKPLGQPAKFTPDIRAAKIFGGRP